MTRSLTAVMLAAACTLAAAPAYASATDDVKACMQKFASLQSFEIQTTTDGRPSTIDVINRPSAMHVTSAGMEMVTVGETTYMKVGGSWQKLPASKRTTGFMSDPIRHMADTTAGVKATDLGMKSIGGETLHAYKIVDKDGDGGIIFVGGDGLPHRFESNDHTVVRMTKFNAVAPIGAPI